MAMSSCNGIVYGSADEYLAARGPLRRSKPQCVVVLRGSQHSGKSWTLNLLIDKLRAKATERIGNKAILGEDSLDGNKDIGAVDRWLCAAAFGFKILVYSAGDDGAAVQAAFSLANAYGCDVMVTASRATSKADSYKSLVAELNRCATPRIEVWRPESEEKVSEKTADNQANELIALLEQLCAPTMSKPKMRK